MMKTFPPLLPSFLSLTGPHPLQHGKDSGRDMDGGTVPGWNTCTMKAVNPEQPGIPYEEKAAIIMG